MTEQSQRSLLRVKMKIGEVEFEIECEEDQLQPTIDKILSTMVERLKDLPVMSERPVQPVRAETCKGVIQKLWDEEWFSMARGLGDVHSELARRGFHYDRTAVAHALIDLVKDGILSRQGRPRRYQYTQKRPP